MVTILVSATFIGAALIRGEALFSLWIPKCAALIRERYLFQNRHLLEEIRYLLRRQQTDCEYCSKFLMGCFAEVYFYKILKMFCWTEILFFHQYY